MLLLVLKNGKYDQEVNRNDRLMEIDYQNSLLFITHRNRHFALYALHEDISNGKKLKMKNKISFQIQTIMEQTINCFCIVDPLNDSRYLHKIIDSCLQSHHIS